MIDGCLGRISNKNTNKDNELVEIKKNEKEKKIKEKKVNVDTHTRIKFHILITAKKTNSGS